MFFYRSTAAILTALSFAFLGLVSVLAAPVTDTDLVALGNDFKALRQVKGHWDGKKYNKVVDAENGRKYQDMQNLHKALGKPDTKASLVEETMGPSDNIPKEIMKQLKAKEPKTVVPTNFKYLLYQWRAYHDYLWFRINGDTNMVVESDWHQDLE
ncbi:hypothetical protein EC968_006090 [Mortierella alpina]|nr:hypothetical protein EC968_006090 [Mortierella alpina]